jgi:hypothetical protein
VFESRCRHHGDAVAAEWPEPPPVDPAERMCYHLQMAVGQA